MISVPQLLGVVAGFGVVVGVVSTLAAVKLASAGKKKGALVLKYKELSRLHFAVVLTPQMKSTLSMRWFGPKFSPKNVPRFYDISSITERPEAFQLLIDIFVARYAALPASKRPTKIIGYDARGFILGAGIALGLGVPFVLLRKNQKSPGVLVESSPFEKEYKEAVEEAMCLRIGSIGPADRVVLVDDLIATGGTGLVGIELVTSLGASVHELAAVIELPALGGVDKIRKAAGGRYQDVPVFTVLTDEDLGPDCGWDPADWKEGSRIVAPADARRVQAAYGFKLEHAVRV